MCAPRAPLVEARTQGLHVVVARGVAAVTGFCGGGMWGKVGGRKMLMTQCALATAHARSQLVGKHLRTSSALAYDARDCLPMF